MLRRQMAKLQNIWVKEILRLRARISRNHQKKQRHAQKRAKTIWHNKKLLDMYAKRIKTLDPEGCKVGKEFLDEVMSNYGNRRTILHRFLLKIYNSFYEKGVSKYEKNYLKE